MSPQRSPASHRAWIFLILAVGLLLRLPLVFAPLTYGTDIWRQADTAAIARHFLEDGFHLLSPQIDWGGAGPGYVECEFPLYPYGVALLYAAFGERLWIGRLLSLLFVIPTGLFFHGLARRLLGARGAILSLGCLMLSPLYLRYSVAVMPESVLLCFFLGAIAQFHQWLADQRPGRLLLSGVLTAIAILVKLTAAHVGLLFLLLLVDRLGPRALYRAQLWLFALVCLLPGLLWYGHAQQIYLQHGNTFGILSGGDSKLGHPGHWFSLSFYGDLLRLERDWVLTELGCVLAPLGLLLSLRRRSLRPIPFGLLTTFVYYLIVARYARATFGIQYHIFAVPCAALSMGLALDWIHDQSTGRQLTALALLFLLLRLGPLYLGLLRPPPDQRVACAKEVARLVPPGERIIVSSTETSQEDGGPNNYQDPVLFFYSRRQGFSLAADFHDVGHLLSYRSAGARYFVIYDARVYQQSAALVAHLRARAAQIGPGIGQGCAIYRLP